MTDLRNLETEIIATIAASDNLPLLEDIRIAELGKKGRVSLLMRGLGKMTPQERQDFGPKLNGLKKRINAAIADHRTTLEARELTRRLHSERIDITLPAAPENTGSIHPITQVMDEVTEIFTELGFSVAEGPEIEEDFYNFTALNIPPEHPARQMHDTFYFPEGEKGKRKLLRTHTSPVQIRTMMAGPPPYRIIAPGRTYRCDSDATHTPMFHQVEALVIDRDIHMGHLKWCIEEFCRKFFELDDVKIRFRPSYFPFTEPSAEVDIGCRFRDGEILIGDGDDWLEIMGCGMVNPRVLENVNIDPDHYQGFAFGMGLDRIAMLKWGIPDLRDFFAADLRWLKHYGFPALDIPSLSTRNNNRGERATRAGGTQVAQRGGASHASGGASSRRGSDGSPPHQTTERGASDASGGASSRRGSDGSPPHQTTERGASKRAVVPPSKNKGGASDGCGGNSSSAERGSSPRQQKSAVVPPSTKKKEIT